jgi:hypothetical protein
MSKRYTEQDFNTTFGQNLILHPPLGAVDYDLIQQCDTPEAKTAIQKFVSDHRDEVLRHDGHIPAHLPGLNIGNGQSLAAADIERLINSKGSLEQLEAVKHLETLFEKVKTPKQMLEFFSGLQKNPDAEAIKCLNYFAAFPTEATYVRLETVIPEIHATTALYNDAMLITSHYLSMPIFYGNGDMSPPIGTDIGPRVPPLGAERVSELVHFWLALEAALGPKFKLSAGSPAIETPERKH